MTAIPTTRHLLMACALTLATATAAPVTPERLTTLPAAQRPAWQAYLETSRRHAQGEQEALAAELAKHGMSRALRPPSGGDFKLKRKPGDPWFASAEAGRLADVILSYQTPTGGWSKHLGFTKGPRQPGMQWTSQSEPGKPFHYPATFDNHSTTAEIHLLANVWQATGREDCKRGVLRGLDYIFAAQYPNGGWPQVYPLEGGYHDDITLNDDAMTHVLALLHDAAAGRPEFAFLDEATRRKAAAALGRGIGCLLRSQVVVAGRKTVWCAQTDPLTLEPAAARKMEPATLSGTESARLLKFLMELPEPPAELRAAIEAGLDWLEGAAIRGDDGVRWARFYDLKTGKPVFPGRDGVLYDSYEAMAARNPTGYDYFSTLPGSVVSNGRKKWLKRLDGRK